MGGSEKVQKICCCNIVISDGPLQLSTAQISLNQPPAEFCVVSITPIIDLFFDETMLSKLSNAQKDVTSAGVSGAAAAL